jgi:hypothetical protein
MEINIPGIEETQKRLEEACKRQKRGFVGWPGLPKPYRRVFHHPKAPKPLWLAA